MKSVRVLLIALGAVLFVSAQASAQNFEICPRPFTGTVISPPPDLFSKNGVLNTNFSYNTRVDLQSRTLFCFQTPKFAESPTLHVNPGDTININLTNNVPAPPGAPSEVVSNDATTCGSAVMTSSSVNMHFHGTNTTPVCHSDEVVHTLVNSGQTFNYSIAIPPDEPPGLYWYHPHVHGLSSLAVQGGASGVIEVEGIANVEPIVAGMRERFLVVRDIQLGAGDTTGTITATTKQVIPSWNLSLNYVEIPYPNYPPAVMRMTQGTQEFWRVANASADTILDLELKYDGVLEPVTLVALDGVPIGSQDGTGAGTTITQNHVFIPPAGRAEFIVNAPSAKVKKAELSTLRINTGPDGDRDPARPLAMIHLQTGDNGLPRVPQPTGAPHAQRFKDLKTVKPTATRTIYFSEDAKKNQFFITVDGQKPQLFDPNNPPAIVTTQGAVEDWTIQNRTHEDHEFHIHQIHYLLEAVNGVAVPAVQQQYYDTFQVPYFLHGGSSYPSITVRMDFRGAIAGTFVYHCHILDHEDQGMMATIQVLPSTGSAKHASSSAASKHA